MEHWKIPMHSNDQIRLRTFRWLVSTGLHANTMRLSTQAARSKHAEVSDYSANKNHYRINSKNNFVM
eukprot:6109534-Amphidinium_carterae.1